MLALKKYDTLAKVADGQATKILIPTDLADLSKDIMVKGELFKSGMSEAPVSATYSRSTASKVLQHYLVHQATRVLQEHQAI